MVEIDKTHYQTLILTLSDGTEVSAIIPACLEPDENGIAVGLKSIRVTYKKPLPKWCFFGEVKEEAT